MIEQYEKILGEASSGKHFSTSFGEIKTLNALKNTLVEKGKPFFESYVTNTDNHFANWVEHVFEDGVLADSMRKNKDYGKTMKLIEDRMKYIELSLAFNREKEVMNDMLINSYEFNDLRFEPTFHKFETLSNSEITGIPTTPEFTKIANPPKVTFISQIGYSEEEKPLLNSISQELVQSKRDKEKELVKSLEEQFPGLRVAEETKKKKSFFTKIFKRH